MQASRHQRCRLSGDVMTQLPCKFLRRLFVVLLRKEGVCVVLELNTFLIEVAVHTSIDFYCTAARYGSFHSDLVMHPAAVKCRSACPIKCRSKLAVFITNSSLVDFPPKICLTGEIPVRKSVRIISKPFDIYFTDFLTEKVSENIVMSLVWARLNLWMGPADLRFTAVVIHLIPHWGESVCRMFFCPFCSA